MGGRESGLFRVRATDDGEEGGERFGWLAAVLSRAAGEEGRGFDPRPLRVPPIVEGKEGADLPFPTLHPNARAGQSRREREVGMGLEAKAGSGSE